MTENKVLSRSLGTLSVAAVRALNPSVFRILLEDKLQSPLRLHEPHRHLAGVMSWLVAAQDNGGGGGGVSAGWSLIHGWLPPYPETTGYIIPTFLDYADLTGAEEFRTRAARMADWELEVQLSDGSVIGGVYTRENQRPAVFNTGQVILGLCRAAVSFEKETYLEAARRAAEWLCGVQAADGSWSLSGVSTGTSIHAYDIRTAWSLLELYALTGREHYKEAAQKNVEWTLAQQAENAWFCNNAFFQEPAALSLPLTHTISYVMEGLLECARLLDQRRLFDAACATATRLLESYEAHSAMAGEFDADWKGNRSFSCLTGDTQVAAVWLQIFQQTGEQRFLDAAIQLNRFVKSTQRLDVQHAGVRGGVKGSHPWYGKYTRLTYINWGAKFLADAIMLERRVLAGQQ